MTLATAINVTFVCGILALAGCGPTPSDHGGGEPFKHDSSDAVYRFAALNLDTFFIYRDRLPSDLFSFVTPEALYRSLGDDYTEFYNPEKTKQLLSQQTTIHDGVGIVVYPVSGGFVITEVLASSPGERDGLKAQDTIVMVNETAVSGLPAAQMHDLLQGENRTELTLRIKRGSEFYNIVVTCGEFGLPSIAVDSIDASTVLITIKKFYPRTNVPGGTWEEFSVALEKTGWAKNTILDLRSNTGGYIEQCLGVASELVPPNTPIITVRYRTVDPVSGFPCDEEKTFTAFGPGTSATRTMHILVDSMTASASEVLLCCLMQREGVTVIGDTTYGKACGQILLEDQNDSVMAKITFMTILPAGNNAVSYDKKGIVPDILCDSEDALGVALRMVGSEVQPPKLRLKYDSLPHTAVKLNRPEDYTTSGTLFTRADVRKLLLR